MRTILTFFIASVLIASPLASGCGSDSADEGPGPSVVVTTAQAADLARNVLGGRGESTQILAANADPHEYEPRPSDAEALAGADLIVRSGGDVDGWLEGLIDSSGSDAPVLTLSDHVNLIEGDDGADPHWWQDPRNAVLAVAATPRRARPGRSGWRPDVRRERAARTRPSSGASTRGSPPAWARCRRRSGSW